MSTFECLNPNANRNNRQQQYSTKLISGNDSPLNKTIQSQQMLNNLVQYKLPERIDPNNGMASYLTAIITAYLAIGRLYSKIITIVNNQNNINSIEFRNWTRCEQYYKNLREYLIRNEDQKCEYFHEYWQKLEEMLPLIQSKIQLIYNQSTKQI